MESFFCLIDDTSAKKERNDEEDKLVFKVLVFILREQYALSLLLHNFWDPNVNFSIHKLTVSSYVWIFNLSDNDNDSEEIDQKLDK